MNLTLRTLAAASALALAATAALPVHAAGRHGGGGGWHHSGGGWRGPVWGGVGLGVGLGLGAYYGNWWYPSYPGYVVVDAPPTVVYTPGAVVTSSPAPAPVMSSAAEPVIYPRSGQSAAQTEADRQQCNRWATTQPAAVADAAVFQRAIAACMDARGYTLR